MWVSLRVFTSRFVFTTDQNHIHVYKANVNIKLYSVHCSWRHITLVYFLGLAWSICKLYIIYIYKEIKVTWWSDLDSVCLFCFCHSTSVCLFYFCHGTSVCVLCVCVFCSIRSFGPQNFGPWTYIYYGICRSTISASGWELFSFFFSQLSQSHPSLSI